jgi:hypothetical protein
LDAGAKPQFYEVRPGKYGQPLLLPEPSRALDLPQGIRYVDGRTGEPVRPDEKIAGIIIQDEAGNTVYRNSLTNAANKSDQIELGDDGSLRVNGDVYYLYGLFLKDKNRTFNYDAYFTFKKPDCVRVTELDQAMKPALPAAPVEN